MIILRRKKYFYLVSLSVIARSVFEWVEKWKQHRVVARFRVVGWINVGNIERLIANIIIIISLISNA